MYESFRAFFEGLIDYAGMFPPAELPMEEALPNYRRYTGGTEAWMLGRFICPASRLEELYASKDGAVGGPLPVSALGRGGKDASALESGLRADREQIDRIRARFGPAARIEVFETRLPETGLQGVDPAVAVDPTLLTWYEAAPADGGRSAAGRDAVCAAVASVAAVASAAAAVSDLGPGRAGFKLRCGGVTAPAFPQPSVVAAAITACRDAGVPFKATAGLHHPVRAWRNEVKTRMHGFLNVFGGAFLAFEHRLSVKEIGRILEEKDPAAFRFTPDSFVWRDLGIAAGRIRELRRTFIASFGSCSFDEPREDLAAIGMAPTD